VSAYRARDTYGLMQSRVVAIVVLYILPKAAAEVECLPLAAMLTAVAVAAVMTGTDAAIGAACNVAWESLRTVREAADAASVLEHNASMRAHHYCCLHWCQLQGSG